MESLIWLVFEIGGLLALAGFAFFMLGWWLKGQKPMTEQNSAPPAAESQKWAQSGLAVDLERQEWERQRAELTAERDSLLAEISHLKSRLETPPAQPKPVKPRVRKSKK